MIQQKKLFIKFYNLKPASSLIFNSFLHLKIEDELRGWS